jgi:opacity protein-like surface antigen
MSNLRATLRFSLLMLMVLSSPGLAAADWTVYGAGHIGISTGVGDVSGVNDGGIAFDDSDRDSSPMISGAVGLAIPMDEIMAWKLPYGLELPDWPVRPEVEFAGLRDFEYRTLLNEGATFDDVFVSTSASWSIMVNNWFDVPTTVLERPVAWAFKARRTTVRRILDPISFYAGAGVGAAKLKVDVISTFPEQASAEDFKFAWQVGTGFGYRLTPFVNVDLGYRYFKTREVEPELLNSGGNPSTGSYGLTEKVHEFRAGLRVNVYSFTSPWARLK